MGCKTAEFHPYDCNCYSVGLETFKIAVDLNRTELFELGRKIDVSRWVNFPTQTNTPFLIYREFKDGEGI